MQLNSISVVTNQLYSISNKHFEPFAFIVDVTKDNLQISVQKCSLILVTSHSSSFVFISCDILIHGVTAVSSNLGMDTYFFGVILDFPVSKLQCI